MSQNSSRDMRQRLGRKKKAKKVGRQFYETKQQEEGLG
jgi:hypothetical protein